MAKPSFFGSASTTGGSALQHQGAWDAVPGKASAFALGGGRPHVSSIALGSTQWMPLLPSTSCVTRRSAAMLHRL
jgi:hypothetical protein